MKYSLSPWQGGGRESLPEREEKQERLQILQIAIFGQNRVPEKDFGALRGAESMKMRCRSVWDHSRGPKPPKMTENPDFSQISRIFNPKLPETKGRPPHDEWSLNVASAARLYKRKTARCLCCVLFRPFPQ